MKLHCQTLSRTRAVEGLFSDSWCEDGEVGGPGLKRWLQSLKIKKKTSSWNRRLSGCAGSCSPVCHFTHPS